MRKGGVLLGAVLFSVTACGPSGEGDPASELNNALERTKEQGLSATTTLEGDADALSQLLSGEGQEWSPEASETLLGSRLETVLDADGERSLLLSTDGEQLLELREVGGTAYMRISPEQLGSLRPGLDEQIERLRSNFARSPELAGLEPLLDGEWVSVELQQGSIARGYLQELLGRDREAPSAGLSTELLGSSTQVTGSGDDLEARVPLAALERSDSGALRGLASKLGSGGVQEVVFEVGLDDGRISSVQLDLSQFEQLDGEAELRVQVEGPTDVVAPDGATPVDLEAASRLLRG